ncbi:cytochrome c oxidase subunit 2A [Cytobacillus sp. S13-E01]|nr:cytochrome c oxidase subunit 2A [Cytobacillus sp. S13-E01]MDF0725906.1 cytochrome c oxidase subunit 2A [Cytobacillus sp. S13-E01]
MGVAKVNQEKKHVDEKSSLKGTFISVGVVGAVIFGMYLLLYGIYMDRV